VGPKLDRWDVAAALIAVVGCSLAAVSFGQDAGFDVKNYHWYAGHQLFGGRLDVDVAPAQIQGFFNPLLHLPLWIATHAVGPRGAAALLGALHGLGPWAVWLIGRRLCGGAGSATALGLAGAAAVAGFVGPIELVSVGTSSGDAWMPAFVLGGLYLLLPGDEPPSPRAVAASGVLAGAAVGLKPTVAMYAAGIVIGLILAPPWPGARRSVLRWGVAAAAAFAVVAGPWMANLLIRYGNPVFPLANNLFDSPWALDFSYGEDRLLPRSAWEAWTFPLQFARGGTHGWEVPFRDARIAVLVAVGAAWAIAAGATKRDQDAPPTARSATGFLLVVLGASYALWQGASSVYRYLGAVELLAPGLAAVIVAGARRPPLRLACAGALLAGIVLWVQPPKLSRVPFGTADNPWSVVLPTPAPAAGSIVLIAGSDALSYLVPSFHPEVRFLRPWSSLSFHDDPSSFNQLIGATLSDHEGAVYLLEGPNPSVAPEVVAYLGFTRGTCRAVRSAVDPELELCRLTPSRAAAY